jgi:magnesium transporter
MRQIAVRKINENTLTFLEEICEGCWVNLETPSSNELKEISEKLDIKEDWLNSCIDFDEKSRIECEDGNVLIIVRIPFENESHEMITIPIGIITTKKAIVTVSVYSNSIINDFKECKLKFSTLQKSRFILMLLERINYYFEKYITALEKRSEEIEDSLIYSLSNKEVHDLLIIQKALIYFSSAIVSNETLLEKINTGKVIELLEEDKELIEDILLSNKEIYEDVKILRDVLSNTLDAYASIISNNLNIVMKFLTSVGIILSLPVFIASLYGMNVNLPFADSPYTFFGILLISIFISIIAFIFFRKKKWL